MGRPYQRIQVQPLSWKALRGNSSLSEKTMKLSLVKCPDCVHEYLLAFSCKRRHFCPSCHQKVLKKVPHRHFILSIPNILRRYVFKQGLLVNKEDLCHVFYKLL
jgi:PHP family Zn ribbon phosphoesterase